MLTSAGFAPVYTSSALESLELAPVRRAIELLLEKQEPYGAVLVDLGHEEDGAVVAAALRDEALPLHRDEVLGAAKARVARGARTQPRS